MATIDSKQNDTFVRRYIGEKIKHIRRTFKINQADIAQHLGITAQQFHKYEKGTDQIPLGKLLKLSKIFRISPEYFYQGLEGFETPHRELYVTCKTEEGKKFSLRLIDQDNVFSEIRLVEKKIPHLNPKEK